MEIEKKGFLVQAKQAETQLVQQSPKTLSFRVQIQLPLAPGQMTKSFVKQPRWQLAEKSTKILQLEGLISATIGTR